MSMKKIYKSLSGFTLIEMSIVLIVISLILGGVLKIVGVQRQQLKRDETRQMLVDINQALIGFATVEGRLPCPDTTGDGIGDPAAPVAGDPCTSEEGFLPHTDLGVKAEDAWGNAFRYRVRGNGVESFADLPPSQAAPTTANDSSFSMDDDGDIIVTDRLGNTIANNIPAIVLSYGENGARTIANGFPCAVGFPSSTEDENCNNDITFIHDDFSSVAGSEYDDLVIWVSLTILKSRMLEAAKLP